MALSPVVHAEENELKIKPAKTGGAGEDGKERRSFPARASRSFPGHYDRAPRSARFITLHAQLEKPVKEAGSRGRADLLNLLGFSFQDAFVNSIWEQYM